MDFLNSYVVLKNLSKITVINDNTENTFFMMANDTTHDPCILQEPDYTPAAVVDNSSYDVNMANRYTVEGKTMQMNSIEQVRHYHINMAAFLTLGEWFDYLRANGVYDNTRIIIVADHGRALGQFRITCNNQDMECFMPLLLVKDFNSKGFNTSYELMTNGDTPMLATKGLIKNPVNPFTGKSLTHNAKVLPQTVTFTMILNPTQVSGNTFPGSQKYSLIGNDPHNAQNWKYLGVG